ncbi:SIR2 family anti-phage-associated protein [Rhodopseudomonas sp.]|uniref:SIR2 family anti-phage-associated protein n=1 Tax=Rhodopseudomonas sp. TaxID=1078 RepID=UPI003B3A05DF
MTFFAIRGSRQLTSEEFLAHLALAIRLENVGVLLGAGASKGVGGMVMADVWALLTSEYDEQVQFLRDNKFLPDGEQGNVELLLDRLEIACLDGERVGADLTKLKTARHALRKAVLRAAILDEKLWWDPDQAILHPKLSSHIRLVSRLAGNRQPGQAAPWAFTTNYDLALEWSAEALGLHCVNGFSGTHGRTFRPSSFDLGLRNVQARGEARFGTYNLYLGKLHGSISWTASKSGSVCELPSASVKPLVDQFIASDKPDDWPGFMIFPGASKFIQTTAFVYGEVIRRFTEFLSRPNACLIVNGYGFTDDHINRLVVSALQNPTLQLIIYLPEIDRMGIYGTLAATGGAIRPNEQLKRLLLAQLPQVTVRGFGAGGFFDALANDLPEPAMLDEVSERARQFESLLRQATNIQVSKKTETTDGDEGEPVSAALEAPPGDGFEGVLG